MKLHVSRRVVSAFASLIAPAICIAEGEAAWQPGITLAPYGWLASLKGDVKGRADEIGVNDITTTSALKWEADDELDEVGFMFYGEWRGERWSVFIDTVWANVSQDGDVTLGSLPPVSKAEVTFDANLYQIGIGYLVLDRANTFFTVYGGGRYYDVEAEVTASGGILPRKIEGSSKNSWTDVVIGTRLSHDFGNRWSASMLADYGFGDSESVWQVFATLDYEFSWGAISGGYRYMALDYEASSYEIDLAMDGPVVGLSFSF